jgi:hypothetical protein
MRWATSAGVIFDTGMAETLSVSMNPACTPTTWQLCGGRVIHEPSVQRTSSPTAGMKPIIHLTSTGIFHKSRCN